MDAFQLVLNQWSQFSNGQETGYYLMYKNPLSGLTVPISNGFCFVIYIVLQKGVLLNK